MTNPKSIAVLPFDNLSADADNAYFADGVTEEIITALSKIEGLKVTARTSSFVFKHHKQDVRQIGQQLGVALLLEGSIRKAGQRVRITAQLIRTDDGFHIWSENFDRELTDIFALQDEVSLLIAGKIREHMGHLTIQDHLVQAPTSNITAYQLYLKGRHYHNKWALASFETATQYYQQSIAADPAFDLPHFGAGLSYSFLGSWGVMDQQAAYQLAEQHFAQGQRLNPTSAYGQYCIAKHQFWGLWQPAKAHATLRQALAANPQEANANEFMAEINTAIGRFNTALQHIEASLQVNPLWPNHYYTKANIYYLQGQFTAALATLEQGLAIGPDFAILTELKLACLMQLGHEAALQQTVAQHPGLAAPNAYPLLLQLLQGNEAVNASQVAATVAAMQQAHPAPLLPWHLYLLVHAGQGNAAAQLLTTMAANKTGQIINFKHDPLLLPLHQHPTYQALASQHFKAAALQPASPAKPQSTALLTPQEADHYTTLLLAKMDQERYYLQPDLSLRWLADTIHLNPNKLSWLLNEQLGKNFYDFVNNYRLKAFQQRALDPQNSHLSLLGLAHDSGFNSKSVFNDYFKKATGTTPKAWVKAQRGV